MLLQAIADRLLAVVPTRAAVARVGGDEFAIVHGPIHQPGEAERLAQQVDRAVAEPFLIQGREVSIGIATPPPDSFELAPLMAAADAALYRDKEGKGDAAVRRHSRAAGAWAALSSNAGP
ncbi:diguanylate cyclase [Methylobacterium sp. 2A]|nr:diguanylate cyclase [Methylobacterium sp. 2A]